MNEPKEELNNPKPRRWLRRLIGLAFTLLLLGVIAYFVATSTFFFKGFVLPRLGRTLNAEVSVADAAISPFSLMVLRDLRVKPKNAETLLTVAEVRASYSLMSILGGTMAVNELSISSPTISLVQNADGTSNLDPILKALATGAPPPAPVKPSKPLILDVRKVTLSNATVRQETKEKGGGRRSLELTNIQFNLANLKNGQTLKTALSADVRFEDHPAGPAVEAGIQARLTGDFDLSLTPEAKPRTILGKLALTVAKATGSMSDFENLAANLECEVTPTEVKQAALAFRKGNTALGQLRVSGPFDLSKFEGRFGVALNNLNLADWRPLIGTNMGGGLVNAKMDVLSQKAGQRLAFKGTAEGQDLAAAFGGNRIDRFGFNLQFAGDLTEFRQLKWTDGSLKFTQAGQPVGGLDMRADYNLTTQSGALDLKLTDLNQNFLRPFLAGALANKQLASVSINANLSGRWDPAGASVLKGDLQVTNLVVKDPQSAFPATPLEFKTKLDSAWRKQVAELREGRFLLTPTMRAANELLIKGQVDFTQANAIAGRLTIAADALDVTRYYDLFSGVSNAPAAQSSAPVAPAPAAKEPDAIQVPVREFTMAANIGQFYLRAVAITNLQATLKVEGSKILLKPCQFSLNGAPLSATVDVNLGMPGYQYSLDWNAKDVPVAPLVDSFQPDRKGKVGGTATAIGQLRGAGTMGASLQKSLTGQFNFAATNLHLSIVDVRSPIMGTLVNTIVGIPDFIRNPGAMVGSLLSRISGGGGQRSGWMDQLTQSPIDSVMAKGNISDGRLNLQDATVQSASFQAQASGNVTLAPILTNSTIEIPIMVSLRRSLADQIGMVPQGTPTNAAYVKLPDFVKIKGTVGQPKQEINYLALTAVAAKGGAGVLGGIGGTNFQGVAGAVGNLLSGGQISTSATNAPSIKPNQAPATNAAPLINLLDSLRVRTNR